MISTPPKTYRFFYHYHKQQKKMSFHCKKQCIVIEDVVCNVPCETKRNKIQPYLVMQGYCTSFEILDNKIIIK